MVDINPFAATTLEKDGFSVLIADLRKQESLDTIHKAPKWDIIIDDASHQWSDQVTCFNSLFSRVAKGGLYIIEDLHTSFGDMRKQFSTPYEIPGPPAVKCDAAEYFMQLALKKLGNGRPHHGILPNFSAEIEKHISMDEIEMITIISQSIIITKR